MSRRLLVPLLLAATAATPLLAQRVPIEQVKIAVWNPASRHELAVVDVGTEIEIAAGQSLMLRPIEPSRGGDDERDYLAAGWSIQSGKDRVELGEASHQHGYVVVRALPAARPGVSRQRVTLRYQLGDQVQVARGDLASGLVPLAIVPAGTTPAVQAVDWAAMLYQGILLREPDPGGRQQVEQAVERDGYRGLLAVAASIAESRESQIAVYERGACNQERLLALHRHLLGVDQDAIDLAAWRSQLARMGQGDIATVVGDLLRSTAFRQRFGL